MKIDDIKIYELAPEVFDYYKKNVKGNEGVSEGQAVMKLSRNIKLAKRLQYDVMRMCSVYFYGNMKITTRLNRIIEIHNDRANTQKDWTLDKQEYQRINKLLGITDDKFARSKG